MMAWIELQVVSYVLLPFRRFPLRHPLLPAYYPKHRVIRQHDD